MGIRSIIINISVLTLLAVIVAPSIAQNDIKTRQVIVPPSIEALPPWYNVEIIIFERKSRGSQGASSEVWPKNIALAYPPNVRSLKVRKEKATKLNADDTASHKEKSLEEHLDTLSFSVLPGKERTLNSKAASLNANRETRVLFHETWRQPMTKETDTPSIIIQGGELFGENQELAGSLSISISRYLHLKTNIWFSEFETNYGQKKEHWPPLPIPPNKIPKIEKRALSFTSFSLDAPKNYDLPLNDFSLSTNMTQDHSYFQGTSDISDTPFLTKNVVLLKQKRRMRSSELHYIDHPKIGLLIRLTPIKKEELTELIYPVTEIAKQEVAK